MKTKNPSPVSRLKKEMQAEKSALDATIGRAACLYVGGFRNQPDKERGPTVEITDNSCLFPTVAKGAQLAVLGKDKNNGDGLVITDTPAWALYGEGLVLVFSPVRLTDQQFFIRAADEPTLKFKEAVKVEKKLRWIHVESLRGKEFVAYARRIIDVANPFAVIIHPLEYLLDGPVPTKHELGKMLGWLLPPSERYPRSKCAAGPDYHYDKDDPQDWWKGDGS